MEDGSQPLPKWWGLRDNGCPGQEHYRLARRELDRHRRARGQSDLVASLDDAANSHGNRISLARASKEKAAGRRSVLGDDANVGADRHGVTWLWRHQHVATPKDRQESVSHHWAPKCSALVKQAFSRAYSKRIRCHQCFFTGG